MVVVTHSVILFTSLSRVILIHYEMMNRHAQSHLCVSSICIRLQAICHNPRKYSLHPSLTNRHRGSCKSQESAIEAPDSSLCATHTPFHPPQSSLIIIRESVIAVLTRKQRQASEMMKTQSESWKQQQMIIPSTSPLIRTTSHSKSPTSHPYSNENPN